MFFDEVNLELEGGRGGDGMLSFHREKYVDEGFPDGGDGGNGGDVYVMADENYNTLQHFAGQKHHKAHGGTNGHKNNRAGANGEGITLRVPVGTMIIDRDSGLLIADLAQNQQLISVSRGGRGGYGNGHFASSTRQAPKFAELGDRGELKNVKFELRIVADVGIIGFPSAGKSTLISHLSDARPKIANYPFTTLIPNLGVVNLKKFGGNAKQSFVIADMPGIIEGASEGKGLGDRFLKHISRTATLIFLLDPFSYDSKSIEEQYKILQSELKVYESDLLKKNFLVCINKIDAIPEEDRVVLKKTFLKKFPELKMKLRLISAVSGEGLNKFAFDLWRLLQKTSKNKIILRDTSEMPEYRPIANMDEQAFFARKEHAVKLGGFQVPIHGMLIPEDVLPVRTLYSVSGKRIEQIVRMTNTDQSDAIARVYDVMLKMGIFNELKKLGAKNGDLLKIEPHLFEFHEIR